MILQVELMRVKQKVFGLPVNRLLNLRFRFLGEAASVKHVGALLGLGGNHTAETQARISKTVPKLGWVASS